MSVVEQALPEKAVRVQAFARFFKNYMSVSALVTASMPIPLTAFGAIPTFKDQTNILSTYTPLFCFLLLGFIFYSRHALARIMFPERPRDSETSPDGSQGSIAMRLWVTCLRISIAWLPGMLIIGSLFAVFQYHAVLAIATERARAEMVLEAIASGNVGFKNEQSESSVILKADRVRLALELLTNLNRMEFPPSDSVAVALGGFADIVAMPSTRDALASGSESPSRGARLRWRAS